MLVALSVLTGCLVYRWSAELFGRSAGLVGLSLWTFCPSVLSWAGVCTVDLGATAFALGAAYALRRYFRHPDWLTCSLAGVALGLAQLCKFSLLILYPVFLAAALTAWWQDRRSADGPGVVARVLQLALMMTVSALAINVGYGFQGTGQRLGSFLFRSAAFKQYLGGPLDRSAWVARVPVPLPEFYLRGIDEQKYQAELHSPAYLRGEWRENGWWYFYLYAVAVKAPLGTLFLGGLAVWLAWRGGRFRGAVQDEVLLWLPAGAVFLLLSTQMRDQFSAVRYVLPAFPFLFIAVSRVGILLENGGRRSPTSTMARIAPRPFSAASLSSWRSAATPSPS